MALRSPRMPKRSKRGGGRADKADDAWDIGLTSSPAPGSLLVNAAAPATTNWLLRGKDGRLTAYAPAEEGVLRWTETAVGGPSWSGPDLLPTRGRPLHLSVAQSAGGYTHLVVLRERPAPDGGKLVDVIYAIQYQTGRPIRDWQTLGNPYKDPVKAAKIGLIASLIDDRGSLHVQTRNADGALTAKRQAPTGRWQPWVTYKAPGRTVKGEIGAAMSDTKVIDVLCPTSDTLVHWRRPAPVELDEEELKLAAEAAKLAKEQGRPPEPEPWETPLERVEDEEPSAAVAPGTITAERTGTGRLTFFWRDAGSRTLRAWRPGIDPVELGGPGEGPAALLRTPVDGVDCTILAQRGTDGRPELAACPTENEDVGLTWMPTGDPCVGAPALALDGLGRVVLAAMGADGTLRVARQTEEEGLSLAAWTHV